MPTLEELRASHAAAKAAHAAQVTRIKETPEAKAAAKLCEACNISIAHSKKIDELQLKINLLSETLSKIGELSSAAGLKADLETLTSQRDELLKERPAIEEAARLEEEMNKLQAETAAMAATNKLPVAERLPTASCKLRV